MKVFVSGSLAYDRVMNFSGRFADHINPKKIHVINLSFAVDRLNVSFGGTAGNIAYNLRLLGIPVAVVSNLGQDGEDYREHMKRMKVDLKYLQTITGQFTAGAYIITDAADNQITGFHSGAMSARSAMPLSRASDLAIISADSVENMVRLALYYHKRRTRYIFDPGQQITALSGSYLRQGMKGAHIIIGNDYEMDLMMKRSGHKILPNQISITTLGEKGSVISERGKTHRIPAAQATSAVDPTGAGDAYRAGLLAGLVKGFAWEKTGRLASQVAAYAVENYGTQNHSFTWSSLQKRYRQSFKSGL